MRNLIKQFIQDERGQDLLEYTLLMAFLALAGTAIFSGAGSSTSTAWKGAKNVMSNAVIASS